MTFVPRLSVMLQQSAAAPMTHFPPPSLLGARDKRGGGCFGRGVCRLEQDDSGMCRSVDESHALSLGSLLRHAAAQRVRKRVLTEASSQFMVTVMEVRLYMLLSESLPEIPAPVVFFFF